MKKEGGVFMIFATISITFDRNIEHSCCGIDLAYVSMIL
jgi:hypothetical protein